MSDVLTPDQVAVVRTIVAEMVGKALAGADQRIAAAIPREAPWSMSDEQLRFECLKLASLASAGTDPRPGADTLFRYVKGNLRRAPDPSRPEAAQVPAQAQPVTGSDA